MAPPPSNSNTVAEIRERKLQRRLADLRDSAERLVVCCPGGSHWLFGSLARGDWERLRCSQDPYWQAISRDALCLAKG